MDLHSTGLQRVKKSSLFKIKSVHFRAISQKYIILAVELQT